MPLPDGPSVSMPMPGGQMPSVQAPTVVPPVPGAAPANPNPTPAPENPAPKVPEPGAPKVEEPATEEGAIAGTVAEETGRIDYTDAKAMADLYEPLKGLCDIPFAIADEQGRYDNQPAVSSTLMCLVNEVAEAHDAYASNRHAKPAQLRVVEQFLQEGDKESFMQAFRTFVKSTFEDELADIVIFALSIARYKGVDIAKHLQLKTAYNSLRKEHSAVTSALSK